MMNDKSTIQVTREVKEHLRKRGEKGDSFNNIIEELLDEVSE